MFDMFCFFVVVVVVMCYFLAAFTFNKFLMTVNERGKLVNQEKTADVSRRHHWFIREWAICTMTSFYYYDQNPSGFCFLVLIRAFAIQTSLGLPNLNMEEKRKGFWS